MIMRATRILASMSLLTALSVTAVTSANAAIQDKYNASCATCHQAGVLGAQKTGDSAAWAKALKKGKPTLLKNVKNGFNNMPARGLCDDCSDADYLALIEFMASAK